MKRPADPNELRKLPRLLRAVAWRLPLEYGQLMGKLTYKSIGDCLDKSKLAEFIPERGETMEETSVTKGQQELLLRAQARTAKMPEAITRKVEPGAELARWSWPDVRPNGFMPSILIRRMSFPVSMKRLMPSAKEPAGFPTSST